MTQRGSGIGNSKTRTGNPGHENLNERKYPQDNDKDNPTNKQTTIKNLRYHRFRKHSHIGSRRDVSKGKK